MHQSMCGLCTQKRLKSHVLKDQMIVSFLANMTIEIPECRDKKPPPVEHSIIPDELLVSLTSTVCNGNKEGHTVHRQRCEVMDPGPGDSISCYNQHMGVLKWHAPYNASQACIYRLLFTSFICINDCTGWMTACFLGIKYCSKASQTVSRDGGAASVYRAVQSDGRMLCGIIRSDARSTNSSWSSQLLWQELAGQLDFIN